MPWLWSVASRIYTWLFFIPLFALATAVAGATSWLLSFVSLRAADVCGVAWGRVMLAAALVRVRVHGRENVVPGRQYVVMCNHRSNFDVLILYARLGMRFLWVMKMELRKAPFLGPACARLGHIFIDRKDRSQAVQALREGLDRASGSSLLFFPEGTRSSTTEMLPFKKGGFVLAADAGLPILPMSLKGSERVLAARSLMVRPLGRVEITFHPAVETSAFRDAASREPLIEAVRARIASGLEDGRQGSAPPR